MAAKILNKNTVDIIFTSTDSPKHTLHMYSPKVNKYDLLNSFFSGKEENIACVTLENPALLAKYIDPDKKLQVIHPSRMFEINGFKKVIVDASSIAPSVIGKSRLRRNIGESISIEECSDHFHREGWLNKNRERKSIICTYDISKLNPKHIKSLVASHDRCVLAADMGAFSLPKQIKPLLLENYNSRNVEQVVKNDLETIVLALTMEKPVSGRDIKESIYKRFNVFLSSGTLYPLLHKLTKDSLLGCRVGMKTKKYYPQDKGKILKILDEHVQAKNFLSEFLKKTANGGDNERKIE